MDIRKALEGYTTLGIPLNHQGVLYYYNDDGLICCKCGDNTLERVSILEGTELIDTDGFKHCMNLVEVYLPKSLHTLCASAFCECLKLEKVTCTGVLKLISAQAFKGDTALKSIDLCGDVLAIGASAFIHCTSLETVNITGTLSAIGSRAFWDTSLRTIRLAEGLDIIGRAAFGETKLRELVLPSTVRMLGDDCFNFSTLETLYLSKKLQGFGILSLSGPFPLKTMHIPKGTSIHTLFKIVEAVQYGGKKLVVHSRLLYFLLRMVRLPYLPIVADFT